MTKIQRATAVELCADNLRKRILDRVLIPGDRVTEDAFAADLGVSRATIRQALALLEAEGLVTRSTTTRVLEVTRLTAEHVTEIYRARTVLELAGAQAEGGQTPERVARLAEAVAEMRRAVERGSVFDFVAADGRCHAAIVGFLQSELLSQVHDDLMSRLRLAMNQVDDPESELGHGLGQHEEFVEMIRAGRTDDAAAALSARLAEAEAAIIGDLS